MDEDRAAKQTEDTTEQMQRAAVEAFYDRIVAYEWSRLDKYVLEFAVVRHYLRRYLPPAPARVLDVGAGPGRYAIWLATQGYTVSVIDLSSHNIKWVGEQAQQAGVAIDARVGDACDLGAFATGSFDAALLLGPLYHLPEHDDRRKAVGELRRVLRPGGIALTMMLTRAAAIYEGLNRWPEGILNREGVAQLLRTGTGFNFERDPHDFEGVYFASVGEVLPLHESCGFSTLALAGCEAMLGGRRETLEQLPEPVRAGWIDLALEVCEDPHLLGAAERLLYIGRAR